MKPRAVAMAFVLAALVFIIAVTVPVMAQTRPSLVTDQALYTLRDKQVLLQGDGYAQKKQYVVWLQTPLDNSTREIGLSFAATDKGQIPTPLSLPIEPTSPLGTYLVSISNSSKSDAAITRAHYGIWGTDKFVYQRTELIQAKGGGILPKAALKVTVRDPTGNEAYKTTVAANETGAFLATWRIPPNAPTEEYTVFIDGTGSYDLPSAEFVSKSKFSATPAFLNVTVYAMPDPSYERMQTASAEFAIRYPDSSPVISIKDNIKPVALYAGQFKVADLGLAAAGNATGIWNAQLKIPKNATLNVEYRFGLSAKAFDDGNGNVGPQTDVETGTFSVTPATLQVDITSNSTHYQVPFDSLAAYARVSYPDGTAVANATVRAWLNAGNSKVNVTVSQDKTRSAWAVSYSLSWGDLLRLGGWRLIVEARDIYGNAGSESLEVFAEPYSLLEMIILAAIVLLVARWLLSRFWRRIYLETKRAISAIRGRVRPPSFGRYFTSSPVTP